MSNPFMKQPVLDAKEYLKNKSRISKFQSLKTKRNNSLNNGYICNNKLAHINGQSNLLDFAKGFYLTKSDCYDERDMVHDITDGRYSQVDFKDIELRQDNAKEYVCNTIENYVFNNCRIKKGLATPNGKIDPKYKTKKFKLHSTNTMVINPKDCDVGFKNNIVHPTIHCSCENLSHRHQFPTNTADITYTHSHDKNSPTHKPYLHPATRTNHYYIAKKYPGMDMFGFRKYTRKCRDPCVVKARKSFFKTKKSSNNCGC